MTPIRIIGIGSPFGDDQLGWEAVEAIRRSGLLDNLPQGMVSTHTCDRPGSGLLALMEGARHVILIDAMRSGAVPIDGTSSGAAPVDVRSSGAAPGNIRRLEKGDIEDSVGLLSSHGFGVASALALGEVLGVLPCQWVCYGVELGNLATDTLSPVVVAALPVLIEKINEELIAIYSDVLL